MEGACRADRRLPAASATTATAAAFFPRAGFVDGHGATGNVLLVQPRDGVLAGLAIVHLDEAEAT